MLNQKGKEDKFMNEKGNFSYVVTFFIIAAGLSFLFIVLVPALQAYNTSIFAAGEPILALASTQAGQINDPTTKAEYNQLIQNEIDVQTTQMDILSTLYQYSWIIILVVSAIVIFLFSRSLVERQTGVY